MQEHAKQRYIFGHLSLIRSLVLDIPSGVATMRDLENGPQKRDSSTFYGTSLFWVNVWSRHLFFVQKNKKKKYIQMHD